MRRTINHIMTQAEGPADEVERRSINVDHNQGLNPTRLQDTVVSAT